MMQGELEMSLMREVNTSLQMKKIEDDTFIRNTQYCLEFLKKYDTKDSKSISTPMASNALIYKAEQVPEIYITKYIGIIIYLLYLTTSRYDIVFSVCMCVLF